MGHAGNFLQALPMEPIYGEAGKRLHGSKGRPRGLQIYAG
jgi:hypothetical protein